MTDLTLIPLEVDTMRLEDELNELLAGLGVVLEDTPDPDVAPGEPGEQSQQRAIERQAGVEIYDVSDDQTCGEEGAQPSELCLFQTSREHYGVFYRLDLVNGAPQLRVFLPDESGAMKMRCYLVRADQTGPLGAWFNATRGHDGSQEYDDARDTAQQHLLFAAGEVMKRLFWSGDLDECRFPAEIGVRWLA